MADQPDIPVLRPWMIFRDGLIEANRLFQVGENDGREGEIRAVKSVIKFLMQIPQIGDQGLIAPLAPLFDALMNLDDGHTQPILKAVRKSGRACWRDSRIHIGAVAFTAARMLGAGMSRDQALEAIAKALNRSGVVASRGRYRDLTARTVRGWCERVAEDVGCHGEAARTCRRLDGGNPRRSRGTRGL